MTTELKNIADVLTVLTVLKELFPFRPLQKCISSYPNNSTINEELVFISFLKAENYFSIKGNNLYID